MGPSKHENVRTAPARIGRLIVRVSPWLGARYAATLRAGVVTYRCVIGRSGLTLRKREETAHLQLASFRCGNGGFSPPVRAFPEALFRPGRSGATTVGATTRTAAPTIGRSGCPSAAATKPCGEATANTPSWEFSITTCRPGGKVREALSFFICATMIFPHRRMRCRSRLRHAEAAPAHF